MGYFSYHARLKQRIRAGELAAVHREGAPYALRLFFLDGSSKPIRAYRLAEYLELPEFRNCLNKTLEKPEDLY